MYSATVKEKHCVGNKVNDNETKENAMNSPSGKDYRLQTLGKKKCCKT